MSIWGNPVMMGGSGGGGGGGGNAWAYSTPPTSGIGSNGDYYFELRSGTNPACANDPSSNANSVGGWEFKANAAIEIVGVRVYVRSAQTGKVIKFGTASGTVLKEVTADLTANEWTEVMFDTPVTLTADTNYVVIAEVNGNTMKYQNSPALTTNDLSYVRGRQGSSFPGSTESGVAYSVDVLYSASAPYRVKKQYYKTGGTWTEVT